MKNRFEVSTEGMRELQAGREPWQLVKELVSNSWDEKSTGCYVILESVTPARAKLEVVDDGPGFADITDAWTLMASTPKRVNPEVRGRFNIGEKEVLSVAIEATVKTAGKIIRFPKEGGRSVTTDPKPVKGTHIVCLLPWGPRQVERAVNMLHRMIPPANIEYRVNGFRVLANTPDVVVEAALDTVVASEDGIVRTTRRKSKVELYRAFESEEGGWLFEMGIPVQPIEAPYWVNVMQKIPLPPNRDVVRDKYLQDVYAVILNAEYELVKDPSAIWVRNAVESKTAGAEALKAVMTKRFGDRAVLWSSNTHANEEAERAGYTVVNPKTLSEGERKAFGMESASKVFGSDPNEADYVPETKWTRGLKNVAAYARMLSRELVDKDIQVQVYRKFGNRVAADFGGTILRFNLAVLGWKWFERVTDSVTGVLIHELSHTEGNGHDWKYHSKVEYLAAKAVHLAYEKPEAFRKFMEVGRE